MNDAPYTNITVGDILLAVLSSRTHQLVACVNDVPQGRSNSNTCILVS